MWGGRFSKKTEGVVEDFTNSLHFDKRLAKYDCLGSLCHIDVLKKAKILSNEEYSKLKVGWKHSNPFVDHLDLVMSRLRAGKAGPHLCSDLMRNINFSLLF